MGLVTIGNIIVTAPTQSQLNSKVEFDMKMTLVHPPTRNSMLAKPGFDQTSMVGFLVNNNNKINNNNSNNNKFSSFNDLIL